MRRLRELARLLQRILKELSDQSAYERHLAHSGRSHSPEEWKRFLDRHLERKYIRPKCC
jgi:hypothetical protein